MAEAFVGQIIMFAGTYAPEYWLECDGSLIPIAEYSTLYTVIGTTYGGDGVSTFGLPDLRGRMPIHRGQRTGASMFFQGQTGGAETVTLTEAQMPAHTHAAWVNGSTGDAVSPSAAFSGVWTEGLQYTDQAPNVSMHAAAVSNAGTGSSHSNLAPYLSLRFIICVDGYFPMQG